MIYQDTGINYPIEAVASLSQGEAVVVAEMLQLRDGFETGIVKSIRNWLKAKDAPKGESLGSNYVVMGEGARQIRFTVAEAALGSVVSTTGYVHEVSDDVMQAMKRINSGEDALRMGQVPTSVTEFEADFAQKAVTSDALADIAARNLY